MKKTVFSAVLLILLTAFVVVSPWGYQGVAEREGLRTQEAANVAQAQGQVNDAELALSTAVQEYNDTRDFDVYYGDVDSILKIFSGLSGISVQTTVVVDPMDNFSEHGMWDAGQAGSCQAVRFDLLVTDIDSAINAITRMQLPVQSLNVIHPNRILVTTLTGGEV